MAIVTRVIHKLVCFGSASHLDTWLSVIITIILASFMFGVVAVFRTAVIILSLVSLRVVFMSIQTLSLRLDLSSCLALKVASGPMMAKLATTLIETVIVVNMQHFRL